jgi:hypothetical protein
MIPQTVKIGGYTVKVEFAKNQMTDKDQCGSYNSRTKTITIDPDLTDQLIFGVFMHEIVEAFADIHSIESLQADHHAINQLGEATHQLLRDNPEILPK